MAVEWNQTVTTSMTLVVALITVGFIITIARVGTGMLLAYYILRVRADLNIAALNFLNNAALHFPAHSELQPIVLYVTSGLPVVLWLPKFWRMDGKRQTGSSLSRVLARMEKLDGPHGMYGTVFGSQAVVHVADPEAAALVLSQHTKRPGYNHFSGFFGKGVFTADGDEWRAKRASVAHAMFRGTSSRSGSRTVSQNGCENSDPNGSRNGPGDGNGFKDLATLANEEADSLLREVEVLRRDGGGGGAVEVEAVRLLQRHTLNLIHRFLCGGDDVTSSPARRRLLDRYLVAVTDMRMVILARSRSMWMFAWGWVYRSISPLHRRETRNMVPIRKFAELVLRTAIDDHGNAKEMESNRTHRGRPSKEAPEMFAKGRGAPHLPVAPGNGILEDKNGVDRVNACETDSTMAEERVGGDGWAGFGGQGQSSRYVSTAQGVHKPLIGRGEGEGGRRCTALSDMAARESHQKYPNSMVDETITLLFAGQDTSAATLSWTMHLLSLPENREYLLEVRREASEAVGPAGHLDASTMDKRLPMVDACIKEAQRLYPVAPFVVRHLSSDLKLKDGTLLPSGALACVWIYGLHHHPRLWKSPDAFVPRRWLDGARQTTGAFIPYASGPRGCVGRPFARVALRILLARVCLAFDFSPATTLGKDSSSDASSDDREGGASDGLATEKKSEAGGREPYQPSLGSSADCKEMQAGFTVLPGGGVHLRLRRWSEES